MSDTDIASVSGWEALDSRGTPTVAAEIVLQSGARGRAVSPSGKSTGRHEAHELRDGGDRYAGLGTRHAVANVNGELADLVRGLDAADQRALDQAMRQADGTDNLTRLGANAVLAISIAAAIAAANATDRPLYRAVGADPLLPMPMVNIISGGAHAGGAIDIQDVLVVPVGATSFAEAIEWASRVRRGAAEAAEARGLSTSLVADEGGLGLPLPDNRSALALVIEGAERAGLTPGDQVALAIDVAAGQFFDGTAYRLSAEDRTLSNTELVDEIVDWTHEFPVVSLEDVLAEDDWPGWTQATQALEGQLLGDDLFATNPQRVQRGLAEHVANAVLVKPNQIGTLTDARDVLEAAQRGGYTTVLSARSGETEDSWLADLAVGWRAGQIKVGSTTRSERTAKWNRLLQIEAELDEPQFAGRAALTRN
jgi:enolase